MRAVFTDANGRVIKRRNLADAPRLGERLRIWSLGRGYTYYRVTNVTWLPEHTATDVIVAGKISDTHHTAIEVRIESIDA